MNAVFIRQIKRANSLPPATFDIIKKCDYNIIEEQQATKGKGEMTAETIWQLATGILIPVVGIQFKLIFQLRADLNAFQVSASQEYANKADIERIENKIDNMQNLILTAMGKK